MRYAVYLVDDIANSEYGYYIIIAALALIAICMFLLIFSQFKLIKMHLDDKNIDKDKSIEEKIEDIEEYKEDLYDTKELPVLKDNIFVEKNNNDEIKKVNEVEDLNQDVSETPISLSEIDDLQSISKEIESKPVERNIELTEYEEEQEQRAIISYDELLAKSDNVSIVYSDSKADDDILVKKVDLEQTGKIELDPIKKEMNKKTSVISYDHEEEFLDALKDLSNLLN